MSAALGSVVVVGGGLAGLQTLAELRSQGYDGRLTWLGDEEVGAYDRPPLSKGLLSRTEPVWLADDLAADPATLTDEVLLDRAATGLRVGADGVVVDSADGELAADAVVVATGAEPVRPWRDGRVLHGLGESRALRETLSGAPQRLVVVGAGWIGAEVAGVAAGAGHAVTVLEAGATPLWRQLGEAAGERTRAWYAEAGVDLRTRTVVTAVADDVVTCGPERFDADVVLVAVGVRPRTAWLGGVVPLLPSGHIGVDRGGRAAVPRVWAVGDVAARETPRFGIVPGGHWFAALRDPALLAADLLGRPLPDTEPAPEVWSDQLGHHLEVVGELVPPDADGATHLWREHPGGGWSQLHLRGDVLHGVVVADHPKDVSGARRLLRGATLPRLDVTAASDPTIPLPRTPRPT